MLVQAVLLVVGLQAHTVSAQCEESFYRHTVPEHVTQSGLKRTCSGPAGRSFTSLYHPDCQNSIYTALHLSHDNAWREGGAEDELWSGEDSSVFIPTLYKRDHHAPPSASLSPLQKVDSLTAKLVESQVVPLCSKAGGDVYIQSGVGGLKKCDAKQLWTAVCCSAPDQAASFSTGIILEGDEVKTVSVEELEKLVGIQELFSGGCGQAGSQVVSLSKEMLEKVHDQRKKENPAETNGDGQVEDEGLQRSTNRQTTERSSEEILLEESVNANDTSESVLLYILSCSFSLLYAPISPVISTVTNFPSQVSYVLQEDAAVLAALPRDSAIVVRDLGCGVASRIKDVWDIIYGVVENAVGSLYYCLSTLIGTLLLSCQEGLIGTGTLILDTLGLTTGTVGQALGLGGSLVGRTGWGLVDYLGTVSCEMGYQAKSVGGGLGTLVWRSLKGVGHTLNTMWAITRGVLGNTVENLQEAFGGGDTVIEKVQEISESVENVVEKVQEA